MSGSTQKYKGIWLPSHFARVVDSHGQSFLSPVAPTGDGHRFSVSPAPRNQTRIHTRAHTHTQERTHMHTCMRAHTRTHTHTPNTRTHTHTHTHTRAHLVRNRQHAPEAECSRFPSVLHTTCEVICRTPHNHDVVLTSCTGAVTQLHRITLLCTRQLRHNTKSQSVGFCPQESSLFAISSEAVVRILENEQWHLKFHTDTTLYRGLPEVVFF